jgi:hypothetical protein
MACGLLGGRDGSRDKAMWNPLPLHPACRDLNLDSQSSHELPPSRFGAVQPASRP